MGSNHRSTIIMSATRLFTPIVKHVINTGEFVRYSGWARKRGGLFRQWPYFARTMASRGKDAGSCDCMDRTEQGVVTAQNLNPCIIRMEYAVRGPLVIRATEIEKELKNVS